MHLSSHHNLEYLSEIEVTDKTLKLALIYHTRKILGKGKVYLIMNIKIHSICTIHHIFQIDVTNVLSIGHITHNTLL